MLKGYVYQRQWEVRYGFPKHHIEEAYLGLGCVGSLEVDTTSRKIGTYEVAAKTSPVQS